MLQIPSNVTFGTKPSSESDSKVRNDLIAKLEASLGGLKARIANLEKEINDCETIVAEIYNKAVNHTLDGRYTEGKYTYDQYASTYRRKIGLMATQTTWTEISNTLSLSLEQRRLESLMISVNWHLSDQEKQCQFNECFKRNIAAMERVLADDHTKSAEMEIIPYDEFKAFVMGVPSPKHMVAEEEEDDKLAALYKKLEDLKSPTSGSK